MADTQTRREKLRQRMRRKNLQALLVTHPANVQYLTGFTGEDSYLLVTADSQVILSDSRFTSQLQEECPDLEAEIRTSATSMSELVGKVVQRVGVSQLGFESDALTVARHGQWVERLVGVELVATQGWVERQRAIKDREEVRLIRHSVRVAEQTIVAVRALLQGWRTERQVAHQIEQWIRECGGEGCSFPPIVAVGDRAALPHAPPTERRIDAASFVLIDWGAQVDHYMSDLTRVLVTGKISPKLQRIYRIVLHAQRQAIAAIRPGVPMHEVDLAARTVITKAGFGKQFGHGLGHGIGLEIHESPRMTHSTKAPLQAGMVVTVEPGIYLPGWGGVRIEDDVLVTRDGHEVLSSLSTELEDWVV